MAAVLKKRALAEYRSHIICEEGTKPIKRLQIIKRSKSSECPELDLSPFDDTPVSMKKVLQTMLNIYQHIPLADEIQGTVLKKFLKFIFLLTKCDSKNEIETSNNNFLIGKAFDILPLLVSLNDASTIIDKIIQINNLNCSNTILSHGIFAAHQILAKHAVPAKTLDCSLQMIIKHLESNVNCLVKVRAIDALAGLCSLRNFLCVVESIKLSIHDQDSRVRSAAFNALGELQKRDFKLPIHLYKDVCAGLKDDYQRVRQSSLQVIVVFAQQNPDYMISVESCGEEIRLVDHVFSQICTTVNDVNTRVRTLAVSLLGSLINVSDHFLEQTLDKKVMSNMRKKTTAHERAKYIISSGGWSSGKKWADDTPKEDIAADDAQIINSGACGAFVHGLEDEFLEVRTASLESICKLASKNAVFANQCLDFLVDMFNDEIEEVRLKAILVLRDIALQIKLRPDQLDEILHALKDSWLDIRETLHALLATIQLCTVSCVNVTVEALLDNLHRYPQDKRSIHKCFKQMGLNHPEFVLALIPQLLSIHPYFDGVEPSLQDGEYICKLVLILNAASTCTTIIPLLEEHTLRHYTYLRDSMPSLIPGLKFVEEMKLCKNVSEKTSKFLSDSLNKVAKVSNETSEQFQQTIYSTVHNDLEKLANIDSEIAPSATLSSNYIHCMLMFARVLANKNWLIPSSLSNQQIGALKANVDNLLRKTLKIRHTFSNLSHQQEVSVRSLRVRGLALQLVYVVHGSTGSALGLCDNFLSHADNLHQYLLSQSLTPDAFIENVIHELSQVDEPKPGAVARILKPLLLTHRVISLIPTSVDPTLIKMAWAEILEPTADCESVFKLGAGLAVGVHLDADLWFIKDIGSLRIKVIYPDHTSHLVVPNSTDIRKTENECYRLLTNVLISAQIWSEACHVGISLVLDMSEQECIGGRRHCSARGADDSATIQLCKPVKILVWPKGIRRGV